ncbi:MAG: beta-ketoacyl-[acyl-carrier-protein] synthase family protein [Epsilonproteobacteria bacterium]|nr:MAG: beta-ketoacyl-[acyl-carrier-protein] synthase family protein [Campylobacterota bacterium]
MTIKNKVFITTTSSISCGGNSCDELWDNICTQKSGITIQKDYFHNSIPAIGKINSSNSFYKDLIIQCQNILDKSDLINFDETLLIIGSSVGGMSTTEDLFFKTSSYKDIDTNSHNIDTISIILQQKFNFYDDISFSTACTSSANAIGYAYEVLGKGIYKNALVVGVDSLCQTTVGGFLSLGVLSSAPCKPFDENRDGMNVAEAIACVLLETKSKKNSVEVCGVGYSSDAYHMTMPHLDGAKTAMTNALKLANITPNQINYINAHGTGTKANDTSEANAISETFETITKVSSTKSITGHTLGAAGAIEAIICTQAILNQTIPTSTNLNTIENKEVNFSTSTRKEDINYVLSNSFAFGGNNCSLVFGKVGRN